jgi:arginyl-tRNA synthetase
MKRKLDILLREALRKCFETQKLSETSLPEYVIEVPSNSNHGHFATNLPLALAALQRKRPRDLATVIVDSLEDTDQLIETVDIAGPGFINFTITAHQWQKLLADILLLGSDYGRSAMGAGQKVLVEFVSANPTGPLHLGHGRGAALGDTLCRILDFTGHEVVREF